MPGQEHDPLEQLQGDGNDRRTAVHQQRPQERPGHVSGAVDEVAGGHSGDVVGQGDGQPGLWCSGEARHGS